MHPFSTSTPVSPTTVAFSVNPTPAAGSKKTANRRRASFNRVIARARSASEASLRKLVSRSWFAGSHSAVNGSDSDEPPPLVRDSRENVVHGNSTPSVLTPQTPAFPPGVQDDITALPPMPPLADRFELISSSKRSTGSSIYRTLSGENGFVFPWHDEVERERQKLRRLMDVLDKKLSKSQSHVELGETESSEDDVYIEDQEETLFVNPETLAALESRL
ncbi:hypothetical protein K470DRAFT_109454 [Piedraia hortae CBS 480.64]|uniref:Uncharacterized protein n=1 Tax=Piedraia hortae CBS 480.64 TaxID=1314780 RepID=A0A6A7BXA1_9PEZI|nr:hypothetical protein K470DRAFT_109454 [Piedraia hortae CBS 480.64]